MSFQNVKPTKPELDRLKAKVGFTNRGKDLLKLKREQLITRLRSAGKEFFDFRKEISKEFLDAGFLLKKTYESIGKRTVARISHLHRATKPPKVDIIYRHEMGIDIPKIDIQFSEEKLPSYPYSNTSLYIDILIKNLYPVLKKLVKLAESSSLMYSLAEDYKKIQRRIDALDDIIIPKITSQIDAIEDILSDETQEEFIRMKKIKDYLEK